MSCDESCMDCTESPKHCIRCWQPKFLTRDGRCVSTCGDGFHGNLERYVCEPCAPGCASCADGLSPNICRTCIGNARLYRRTCVAQCPISAYSLDVQGTERACFDTCPPGYFPQERKCIQCAEICLQCYASARNCSACLEGDVLQPTEMPDGSTTYLCLKSCNAGYVAGADQICTLCSDDNCLQCYLGGQFCETCRSSFKLQLGECVASCSRGLFENGETCSHLCPESHYGDRRTWRCERCQGNCRTCSNATHCTSCFDGFYIKAGECVRDCGSDYISLGYASPTDVRLIGGDTSLEGRVEILFAGLPSSVVLSRLLHEPYFLNEIRRVNLV